MLSQKVTRVTSHRLKITSHHNVFKMSVSSADAVYADATHQQHVQKPRDSGRPTRCWCDVSVHQRPRSRYDRLAPEAHFTPHELRSGGLRMIFWTNACAIASDKLFSCWEWNDLDFCL